MCLENDQKILKLKFIQSLRIFPRYLNFQTKYCDDDKNTWKKVEIAHEREKERELVDSTFDIRNELRD